MSIFERNIKNAAYYPQNCIFAENSDACIYMNIKNGLPFRGTRNLSPEAARDIKAFAEQVFETPQLISEFKQYKKLIRKNVILKLMIF